jgi:hypothetical protein
MRFDDGIQDLEALTRRAQADFGGLSGAQLNWKPAAGSWSVAQCLDHLITINALYFPLFEALREGGRNPTFWERYSPFSGLLGRLLIRSLSPDNPRRTRTSRMAEPSASTIDDGIVARFAQHQAELIEHLRRLPPSADGGTIITSPLLRGVTYSLDDGVRVIVVHEQRHLQQARRVVEAPGFPAERSGPAA